MPVNQVLQDEIRLDDVRVVAVDSRRERRQVMRQLLEHSFTPEEIAEVDSRSAAVELVGRCHPDLVVIEIQMPLQEGLDTISDLSRMSPRPRIVVCSFRGDPATMEAARERGADAYVAKPAGSLELRMALEVPQPEGTTTSSTPARPSEPREPVSLR